jgi:hypothetical protein
MNINDIHIFISKTNYKWVLKEFVDDLNVCMQYLHQQLKYRMIDHHKCNVFNIDTYMIIRKYIFQLTWLIFYSMLVVRWIFLFVVHLNIYIFIYQF